MDIIRIFLVDDDVKWVKAMTIFLDGFEDIMVIGNATSRNEAVTLSKTLEYDIVLMDINLNNNMLDGIHASSEILKHKECIIIMLTSMDEEYIIRESFNSGAIDFVNKGDIEILPFIIRKALKQNTTNKVLLKELSRLKKLEQLKILSFVEMDIFELAEKGYNRSQIAQALYRSENTVKKQIASILRKLNAASLSDAVNKVNNKS